MNLVKPIYLDCQATTPLDPRVLAAMMPYLTESFGNPGSSHVYGWEAQAAIAQAREIIARSINASPEEIIFTSGATEANNLAIKGVAEANFSRGQHLITVQTEHSAVLDPCAYLATLGFEITYLAVDTLGTIDLSQLSEAIRADTILVSVMAANNEIGVLQPLEQIGKICRDRGVFFHSDGAQAIGKIELDVEAMQLDLLSLTAHKVYGVKGIGALYIRRKNPRVNLAPQLHGGGQERGFRSGTLYPPQIVGFGKAIELAIANLTEEQNSLRHLQQQLWQAIKDLPGIHLNGHPEKRLAGNLNVSFEQIDGNSLMLAMQPVVALSSGAACSSSKTAPSHVLTALGRSRELAYASLRFGIGRFNTSAEIDLVAQKVIEVVSNLRSI
jgi:cysteine desulfurase